ncbi:hypothetical protein Btru_015201 [Bulinus truncatus]|nr:hypothetical protein Btru_015201 [Bulinus truncatus]
MSLETLEFHTNNGGTTLLYNGEKPELMELRRKKKKKYGCRDNYLEILKTDGHSLLGKNSTAIEKLKKLYQQCMDDGPMEYYFRDTSRVLQVISELGSWTLTNYYITPWNNDTWSLQTSIEQLHMFTINGLFTMSVTEETDDNDKINYILQLNISHYMTARFNGAELPSGINVSIITPGYFHKLKDLIKETDKKVLDNYMMWNFINFIADALPIDFNEVKKNHLHKDLLPRFETCMRKTKDVLDLAITALYVDSNNQLNFQSKPKVNGTVNEIKNEIVANLKSLTWLDYRTRKHLQKKSELLKYNIGYPDWIMDVDKLDEHYEKVNVDSDYYLYNYLNTSRYTISKNLELLWKSPDEKQWIESPIAGAPFYFNRTVYITTSFMQSPFYDPTFPVPFYYGSIGFLAAQEILHDFHVDHSWLKFTTDKYFNRAKCFHDQYNKFIVQRQHTHINLWFSQQVGHENKKQCVTADRENKKVVNKPLSVGKFII